MDEPQTPGPVPPEQAAPRRRWSAFRFRHAEHPLVHLGLLLLTLATTTVAGTLFFSGAPTFAAGIPAGLRFSIPALMILGAHEMGHYGMCRYYGLAATRPYFLPAPTIFGTLGAVIRIKEPIRRKSVLLDVGAAGPIAGFVMTLPFLFYGVQHATPVRTPPTADTQVFGYPLAVRFAQDWTGMSRYTSATVHEDPTFMAAWLGLFVTALNLLPIGQLDGGHVLRAVLGRRQPTVSLGVFLLALATALRGGYSWALFALIVAVVVGIRHPPVEDDDEPIGTGRLTVALVCLALFLLCFTLVPLGELGPAATAPPNRSVIRAALPFRRQIDHERRRPVVDERDLHGGPEDAARDGKTGKLERGAEVLIERLREVSRQGVSETRAAATGEVRQKRELGHREDAAARLPKRQVHFPGLVLEDSKTADLSCRFFRLRRPIADFGPDEHEETPLDLSDDSSVDFDTGPRHPLDDEPHASFPRRRPATARSSDGSRAPRTAAVTQ